MEEIARNFAVLETDLLDMLIIPEELVTLCSEQMEMIYGADPENENNFDIILKKGELLKEAGRTPVYLCTPDMKTLTVTTIEKINKQYN